MEVSGVVSRQAPYFSGAGINTTRSFKPSSQGELRILGRRDFGVSLRTRRSFGHLNSGFCDDGHLQYYKVGPSCGGCKKEKEIKKMLKVLKGLSEDLSAYSQMGFGPSDSQEGLVAQFQGNLISKGAEALLLKQLEQLREEEKELKKKRKEERARLKAERMRMMNNESSSSSSSESSESECGEVVDMNCLRIETSAQPDVEILPPLNHQKGALLTQQSSSVIATHQEHTKVEHGTEIGSLQNPKPECSTGTSTSTSVGLSDELSSSVIGVSAKRIEVCMGNKCKKSGGGALLEEFGRVMGDEVSVVGCKCMGKCKSGPNVRVLSTGDGIQSQRMDDSVRTPSSPLYIGVGLEDVSLIVANLIGEEQDKKDLGLGAGA